MLETLAKLDAYTKLALKGRDIKGGSMMTPVFVLLIVFGLLVAYGMVSFARAGFHMRAAPKTALPFFKDPRGALAALLISGGQRSEGVWCMVPWLHCQRLFLLWAS